MTLTKNDVRARKYYEDIRGIAGTEFFYAIYLIY